MAKRSRLTGSNLGFLAMVLAAGTIAWYGTSAASSGQPATTASAATIAPAADTPIAAAVPANLPDGPRAASGALPTRVVIAAAGIDTPIVEVGIVQDGGKASWETAWRAAGHHLDSARPGQPGNMVLTGHVSVADRANVAVFKTLDRAHQGDVVEVYSGDEVHRYRIDRIQVTSPSDVSVLRSDHRATVTLVTCTPDLKHRLVVTGTLI